MAIQNPRFEVAGKLPGEAEGWTLNTQICLREFAGFGGEPEVVWERFDRWWGYWEALKAAGFVIAFFDNRPEGYEDFEENWQNDLYLRGLADGHVEVLGIERMESQPYRFSLEDAETLTAGFNGGNWEGFELESFFKDLEQTGSENAVFDNGSKHLENFLVNKWK